MTFVMTDTSSPAHSSPSTGLTVAHAVQPFYLDRAPVRGRLIRLGPLAQDILSRHDTLPDAVKTLGGEGLALVAAMATALKFSGTLSLQIKGDGPISLFLVDCTDKGELRFMAQMSEKHTGPLPDTAKGLLGDGYFAFTIDQGPNTERHQGITSLEGKTLADMATRYFTDSEQHPCSIHLFARPSEQGWQAGALVLERLAGEGSDAHNDNVAAQATAEEEDVWETACTFAGTLNADELFNPELSAVTLINRLFGTLSVQCAASRPLSFGCRCDKERMRSFLTRFSDEELDEMAQNGVISMNCGFCNTRFDFNRDDLPKEDHHA